MDCTTIADAIANVLRNILGEDGFDVLPHDAGTFVDIAADEWTLRIEGTPVTRTWLSIEDEPDDADRLPAARRNAMPEEVDRALATADQRLGGTLVNALRASGDPLTLDLATALSNGDNENRRGV